MQSEVFLGIHQSLDNIVINVKTLTTAPRIIGLMFANSGDTVIDIVPGFTNNLGWRLMQKRHHPIE